MSGRKSNQGAWNLGPYTSSFLFTFALQSPINSVTELIVQIASSVRTKQHHIQVTHLHGTAYY